jgi:hypothetical protein
VNGRFVSREKHRLVGMYPARGCRLTHLLMALATHGR